MKIMERRKIANLEFYMKLVFGIVGGQFLNILSLYLFLFSMVIGLIALVVKGILVFLFCWILFF